MGILAPAPVRAMSVEIVTAYKSPYINDITISPFPAGAGMNLDNEGFGDDERPVPRRRGDEPYTCARACRPRVRSPQARG